jgi:hypothetical protein
LLPKYTDKNAAGVDTPSTTAKDCPDIDQATATEWAHFSGTCFFSSQCPPTFCSRTLCQIVR